MKPVFNHFLVFLIAILFLNGPSFSSGRDIKEDNINVEPIQGKPHHYSVNIKFSKIDKVLIGTTINAESLGQKKHSYVLSPNEWSYDYNNNLLIINKDVDQSIYIVRVIGKYQTPICIIPNEVIDPSSIRFVVNGKIGIQEKDFKYDKVNNNIELMACKTGQEKYIIQFRHADGSASIGSASITDLTLPLLKYLDFPIEGNSVSRDNTGLKFSPKSFSYRSVWMVQLIPVKDGYPGHDLLSGFKWDAKNNELTLDTPVDTEKFNLMIYGEID